MSTDIAESLPKRKFAPAPMVAKGAKGKGPAPKGGGKKEAPKGKSGGGKGASEEGSETVSYTHLTLPTILRV